MKFFCCSFSQGSPKGLSKVNQHLGEVAWKTRKNDNGDKEENEERILEKREICIGFEAEAGKGNEAKINVVVETHF